MSKINKHQTALDQGADLEHYRRSLEYALGIPFTDGNKVEILQNGVQIFPGMLEAIRGAQKTIDFVTFVYWRGDIATEFAEALADRAKNEVTVRLLLDSFGAKKIAGDLVKEMQAAGVQVRWFRPLATWRVWRIDKRTHRKLLICDNEIGFTGGVGIAEEWQGDASGPDQWRDTHARIQGVALKGLRAAFLDNWNEAGAWLYEGVPKKVHYEVSGDIPVQVVRASATLGWTDMACLVRTLIAISQNSLRIVTAYFTPDPLLVELIKRAVERGVDVQILVPGDQTDSRLSQLAGHGGVEKILQAGANVWRYQKTLLHAKIIIVDSLVCCIGSANLNYRSMGKDEECCVVALSERLSMELNERFDADCQDAERLCYEEWAQRNFTLRIKESCARLLVEQL
ncbi:MAG: phospholipase D-like domain-containing protein [Gammaproteobacteria bacterium]|nr:phospholipase D-like domain-containing protein [Gammaproteobacteria bacterium]